MKYVDTHAHLNLSAFTEDRDAVLEKCASEEVAVINIGTKLATSKKAVDIASKHDNQYAIVGLHPIQTVSGYHDDEEIGMGSEPFTTKGEEFITEEFRTLATASKVVGIGECGFDYYHCDSSTYAVQERAFIAQIELANELMLPLMIHTRNPKPGESSPTGRTAYEDVYAVLRQYAKVPGNIHFFAGSYDDAKRFIDLGFTISFTGVITFATQYQEVVRAVPLTSIHGETDCPYVAPVPFRGQRAEPWMVREVYAEIAKIKGEDEEIVRAQLLANAKKLYPQIME